MIGIDLVKRIVEERPEQSKLRTHVLLPRQVCNFGINGKPFRQQASGK